MTDRHLSRPVRLERKRRRTIAKTIQVQLAEHSCKAGLRYAQNQSSTPPKDAVVCCEDMCLKGKTARMAVNLIAHKLVPDKQSLFAAVGCFKQRECTDKLFPYDQNRFGGGEMADVDINANADKVAAQVVEKYLQ